METKTSKEKEFRMAIETSVLQMAQQFTMKELLQVTYAPLVVQELAWICGMKAVELCARDKISEMRKISRDVRKNRDSYVSSLNRDLKIELRSRLERESKEYYNELSYQFLTLRMSVNNELMRLYPNHAYLEMRTYAVITKMLIRFHNEWNDKMDNMVVSRVKVAKPTPTNPHLELLRTQMDAMIGDCEIEYNNHMKIWIAAFNNKIKDIDCKIV